MTQQKIDSTLIEYVDVTTLETHPKNARQGDVGAIITSIQANGWFGTIVAQRSTRYILAGNHRFMAALQVGLTHVPVFWVDCDDAQALRILVADNRTSDIGIWNEEDLKEILIGLDAKDMLIGTGYDKEDLQKMIADIESEDQTESEPRLVTCPKCGEKFNAKEKGSR